jgi:hypothetical protein
VLPAKAVCEAVPKRYPPSIQLNSKANHRLIQNGNDLDRQIMGFPHGLHRMPPYAALGLSTLANGINGGLLSLSSSLQWVSLVLLA